MIRARLFLLLVVVGVMAAGATRVPGILAGLDLFRIQEVELEGARFLTVEEAVQWAAVPSGANVWDDPGPWEERLRAHPLVRSVRAGRDLPGTLVLRVEERKPVALLPTPTLEPVDSAGSLLPLDPAASRLDLPVIHGEGGHPLATDELRLVAGEVARIEAVDPRFFRSISELTLGDRNDMVATLSDPAVRIRFRPPLGLARLNDGLRALEDARGRQGGATPESVDLRYADQVVIGFGSIEVRPSD